MSSKNLTLADACIAIVDCEHKTAPIDPRGQYFAVGTPAMRGNRIDYGEARRVSEETFKAWTRRLAPRPGDLLFAREAPVGPVVRIPETLNVAPGQRTVLLRPDPFSVESDYLFYLLTSPEQQVRLLQKAEGSTVPHLNVADVRSFELPKLPPLNTQKEIAAALRALDDKIESNGSAEGSVDFLTALRSREDSDHAEDLLGGVQGQRVGAVGQRDDAEGGLCRSGSLEVSAAGLGPLSAVGRARLRASG